VACIGYVQNGGVVTHTHNGFGVVAVVSVVVMKGCTITNAKEVRDSEGGFVRDEGSEQRLRPVFGRLC
jgi:hypothetical protein